MFGRKSDQEKLAKEAERKRDDALADLERSRKVLMKERAEAEATVTSCIELLSSMRSTSFKMRRRVRTVARAERRFKRSDEIVRKQFGRDAILTGAAAVSAGGILGAAYRFATR